MDAITGSGLMLYCRLCKAEVDFLSKAYAAAYRNVLMGNLLQRSFNIR